jgi:hypothetical protein
MSRLAFPGGSFFALRTVPAPHRTLVPRSLAVVWWHGCDSARSRAAFGFWAARFLRQRAFRPSLPRLAATEALRNCADGLHRLATPGFSATVARCQEEPAAGQGLATVCDASPHAVAAGCETASGLRDGAADCRADSRQATGGRLCALVQPGEYVGYCADFRWASLLVLLRRPVST